MTTNLLPNISCIAENEEISALLSPSLIFNVSKLWNFLKHNSNGCKMNTKIAQNQISNKTFTLKLKILYNTSC